MTYSILGRAATAVAITAVFAAAAQAQRPARGAPRMVLGNGRALIISAPVTVAKLQPTVRDVPKTRPNVGAKPATSVRPGSWPDKAAMFKTAGIAVITEDSTNLFDLDGQHTMAEHGAMWALGGQLRPNGIVTAGGEVTVGIEGRFAREHPSLQLHFYVRNDTNLKWRMRNLIDGSDIDVPTTPKLPSEIVIIVNVPADFIRDDRLDSMYGVVTLGLPQKVQWELHRVEVMPISATITGQGA